MMRWAASLSDRPAAALVVLWAAASMAACAFPAIGYRDDDGGGAVGGSGGDGGGGGEPACLVGDLGGCGEGNKCSVVNLTTGEVGCVPAGPRQWWSRCNLDSDCIEGAFCDPTRAVCKPFCTTSADCVFGGGQFQGECLPLGDGEGNTVPGGHNLCIPNCEPKSAAPCDSADYVTCVYVSSGRFDCIQSVGEVEGSACETSVECEGGLVCVDPNMGASYCARWCTPVGAASIDCFNNATCVPLNPSINYKGVEHGSCPPPP